MKIVLCYLLQAKMNTVDMGNDFETKCFKIIEKAITDESLGLLTKYVKIHRKKGYYSEKRKKDIIFDLAIEVWPPNADRFSVLYLIECKSYSKRIPVDDVEEFYAKITQVAGVNVKGVLITNKGFQDGAYQYAASSGMMLILAGSNDNYDIILHRKNLQKNNCSDSTFTQDCTEIQVDRALRKVLRGVLGLNSPIELERISNDIKRFSKVDIERIAEAELQKINPEIIESYRGMSYETLERYIRTKLNLNVLTLESSSKLLGGYSPVAQTIWMHPTLVRTPRGLFVLAHEMGHYILHSELRIEQDVYDKFRDPEVNFRTGKYDLSNPKHWIEWQANCFAAALVLPQKSLIGRLFLTQKSLGWQPARIYVDDQPVNIKAYYTLIEKLSYIFNVTKTNVRYRLEDLKMLTLDSRTKHISEILRENNDYYF